MEDEQDTGTADGAVPATGDAAGTAPADAAPAQAMPADASPVDATAAPDSITAPDTMASPESASPSSLAAPDPAAVPAGPDAAAGQIAPDAIAPGQAVPDQPASLLDGIVGGVQQIIDLGGPIVALLVVLSIIALTIALVKLWQFVRVGAATGKLQAAVERWSKGDVHGAAASAARLRGPLAGVINRAMQDFLRGRSELHVREAVEQSADEAIGSLRAYLRALEAIAQAAPLLGLLGTVMGMIDAFKVLESSGGDVDPAGLAGGIWVALMTTAVGLAVAIPTALALHWFDGRVDRDRRILERLVTVVLTHPPAPGTVAPAREAAPAHEPVTLHPADGRMAAESRAHAT